MNEKELTKKAYELRKDIWKLIYESKTGHTGSSFSCIDILTALYYDVLKQTPETFGQTEADSYIQSKGHAVEALFAVLSDRGYFPKEDLANYSGFKTQYIGHPTNKVNGIEMNTGSLGHGLGIGVGIALAAKQDHLAKQVYVLMGDGEQAEGSVWEAAMAAGNYRLNNLTAIIDHNGLQISGATKDVMNSEPLAAKYEAFGFDVKTVSGNDPAAISRILRTKSAESKPQLVIAQTVKGKGISFMENQANWHHKVPSKEQYEQGLAELNSRLEEL
ncbi:transketolase [Liquorilactobacillus sucicola DSM 21376 = JCM 15457]|uniref:Transketolase n=1 Tax=Liquorilactobacillus sucicola DSM 21376 = JCM 15457 TaxID=1423806 RepID=A0A023D027_9LACO|nr:transketolase [Liquorilactobacillus sucicola]KRN06627.1 transketolase [Liquorilactobacillus sucicola DSM 21376 = JCM 15457]GAJ27115.1 transketolase [Liquorilactobacillus sucicola DSM 21376 = JCM 15457]